MREVRKVLLSFLVLALLQISSVGQAAFDHTSENRFAESLPQNQPIRVLFIGNSYTYYNDLPWLVNQLAASAKQARSLETAAVTRGGATLKRHWEEGEALKQLKGGRWDYVVLQEQSLLPITDRDTMQRYARLFDAEIKKAGAKAIFYMTWARQNRPEMQAGLTDAYTAIARELGAMVAPVGIAWQNAFKENAKLILHDPDGSHPNSAGSYLAACVFYAMLYDKSPEGLPGRIIRKPSGSPASANGNGQGNQSFATDLSQEDAALIQRVAWQTVKRLSEKSR